MTPPPRRPLRLAPPDVEQRALPDGSLLLRARQELEPYPRCVGDLLASAAAAVPERTFLAERPAPLPGDTAAPGDAGSAANAGVRDDAAPDAWRRLSYAEALAAVERLAAALLARGLSEERPLALLSGNGIDHALLQLAAMHTGIPVAPISPAYSLQSRDHARLRAIVAQLRPGLLYADDGALYGPALAAATVAAGSSSGPPPEVLVGTNPPAQLSTAAAASGTLRPTPPTSPNSPTPPPATRLADLLAHPPGAGAAAAARARFAAIGPDTVAKVLFTSGSTSVPKGVVNTQRMLCSNQQAIAQTWLFLADHPPVIVDWLPWSHTFGGNHNFDMVLYHRGTLYIDRGKPLPEAIAETVRNLRAVSSTLHFNVPRGFDMLLPHLERDETLRHTFFADLDALFYAAAALPQHLWDAYQRLAVAATGRRVPMLSAWGATETAPTATQVHFPIERAGVIGTPIPGTDIKLAPVAGRLELRVRGPNVTPGYLHNPAATTAAFDADGFLRTGDAGRLADPADPSHGLLFDGRLAEDFKLMSGTWVRTAALRAALLAATTPLVQDLVLTGHDQESLGLLAFPNPAACLALWRAAQVPASTPAATPPDPPLGDLVRHPAVRESLRAALAAHNAREIATSRRIAAALLLAEPPSIDAGEITDKGNLNLRAVRERRAALVARLHAAPSAPPDPDVIRP